MTTPKRSRVVYKIDDDLTLLREVVHENPFEMPDKWDGIGQKISDEANRGGLQKSFAGRSCRERVSYLLSNFKKKDNENRRRSGTEEQVTEFETLLQEVLDLYNEFGRVKKSKLNLSKLGSEARDNSAYRQLIQEYVEVSFDDPQDSNCSVITTEQYEEFPLTLQEALATKQQRPAPLIALPAQEKTTARTRTVSEPIFISTQASSSSSASASPGELVTSPGSLVTSPMGSSTAVGRVRKNSQALLDFVKVKNERERVIEAKRLEVKEMKVEALNKKMEIEKEKLALETRKFEFECMMKQREQEMQLEERRARMEQDKLQLELMKSLVKKLNES